ncbi:Photosystem I assembly protein Ycf3 [invertebrate metagenome]|uniref:Photosystem I assembly protein Ycf3 n=1 Tax=invertebrate metagenome TaxID=1711999 RepID=A0A2H9T918_9ZZZZ
MKAGLNPFFVLLVILLAGCAGKNRGIQQGEQYQAVDNYLNLARGYIREGHSEKALKPVNRALEINSRSSESYGVLALAYQLQGEMNLASRAFKKALSYDSEASDIRNNYGAFLFQQGEYDKAYKQFSKAAADVRYDRRSRAFENLGIVALRLNDPLQAIAHLKKSLQLNPELPRAHLALATLFYEEDNYQDSLHYYHAFRRLSRQTPASLLLGVRLSRQTYNKDAEINYASQLERLYPYSQELQIYRNSMNHDK